ncbi:hypothetical protein W386_02100 [Staphylococcus aureus DAR116]|nr:hypothetical protein W386_02100 [Staphylococcus aureus DAR116]CAC6990988.1 Uncharacterised protein [Staphylococcus aureus]CXJ36280.1 Uncharacterised protein [Staphylococcus aureus]
MLDSMQCLKRNIDSCIMFNVILINDKYNVIVKIYIVMSTLKLEKLTSKDEFLTDFDSSIN